MPPAGHKLPMFMPHARPRALSSRRTTSSKTSSASLGAVMMMEGEWEARPRLYSLPYMITHSAGWVRTAEETRAR